MCVQTMLLFLVCMCVASVLPTQVTRSGSDECFFVVDVPAHRMVSFDNINWPEKYSSGEICQWMFQCPDESYCRLRCPDVGLPETDGCYMDKLLVYTKGEIFRSTTREPTKESARHHSRESARHPFRETARHPFRESARHRSRKSARHLTRESARTRHHARKPSRESAKKPARTSARYYTTDNPQISMEQAEIFCGRSTINVRSNGTKIAMVLISNELSPGGRFRCTVTPERRAPRTWRDEGTEPPNGYYGTNKY